MAEGISHIAVAGFDVWCLEDGKHVFAPDVFPGFSPNALQDRLAAAGDTEIKTAFNAYLIRDAAGVYTLIDTGCGSHFGPGAGFLQTRLAALDVAPSAIARLIITHLHTDHCGGAMVDGQPVFANAEVILQATEQAYWSDQDSLAQAVLACYAPQIRAIGGDEPIAPGLTAWGLPGHTPGHMGLRVGNDLVLVADIIHAAALQMAEPAQCPTYDIDPTVATQSRLMAMTEIAATGVTFSGSHLVGPDKFAKLMKAGAGFQTVLA